jgi:signal transduction histidine kinase
MEVGQWLTLVTCGGLLALGFVTIQRIRTNSLAGTLAALCLISFTWNFAIWAYSLTAAWPWLYVDRSASPWTVPVALRFVLIFVGLRRQLRWIAYLESVAFGVLSAIALSGFVGSWGREAAISEAWDNAFAILILPNTLLCVGLLVRHMWIQRSAEEKMRTRLVIAAVISGAVLAVIELLLHDHIVLPSMLVTLLLLTMAAFRLRMLSNELVTLATLYSIALAVIASGSSFIAFRTLAPNRALTALAISAIGVCWIALLVQTVRSAVEQRAHVERLAMLGKLTEQMAHDLKNPLAALKGAAQYLHVERARGRSIDDQTAFLDLLVSESERLSRLIDKYQRLGRVESSRAPVAVNDLVKRVMQVHGLAVGPLSTKLELGDALPVCPLDEDLAATAIENVLRNATEAMKDGGTLTVRTEMAGASAFNAITITIEDSGCGMDARELDQAFNEFFTTKPTGSGLGLPMVKRVVEAHGGSVKITSSVGVGTKVSMMFPLA